MFLKATGTAVLVGTQVAHAAPAFVSFPRTTPDNSASPRLLSGCCAYSYRKYLADGRMTMEDFIRKGIELAIDGVNMTGYWYKFD